MKTCVIITSVIAPWVDTPLSYGPRSGYAPEERYAQTLETIASVRKYIPNAEIVFVEGGKYVDDDIKVLVNRYLWGGVNLFVRKAVSNPSKAWGEIVLMLYAYFHLPKDCDYYFKLSGRYCLNANFDITQWCTDRICGKDIYGNQTQISTRLIGIPRRFLSLYYKALLRRFWRISNSNCVLESYILKGIGLQNVHFLPTIGVEGFVGTGLDRNLLKE